MQELPPSARTIWCGILSLELSARCPLDIHEQGMKVIEHHLLAFPCISDSADTWNELPEHVWATFLYLYFSLSQSPSALHSLEPSLSLIY